MAFIESTCSAQSTMATVCSISETLHISSSCRKTLVQDRHHLCHIKAQVLPYIRNIPGHSKLDPAALSNPLLSQRRVGLDELETSLQLKRVCDPVRLWNPLPFYFGFVQSVSWSKTWFASDKGKAGLAETFSDQHIRSTNCWWLYPRQWEEESKDC